MSETNKPRQWTLTFATNSEGEEQTPVVTDGPVISGYEAEVKVIELAPMLKMMDEMAQALEQSRKRFSHIEDWHRDNVTPDNFEDCQEVGQTPENYLRDGKINCDKKLESYKTFKKEYGLDEKK